MKRLLRRYIFIFNFEVLLFYLELIFGWDLNDSFGGRLYEYFFLGNMILEIYFFVKYSFRDRGFI